MTIDEAPYSVKQISHQIITLALTQMTTDVSTATFLLPVFLAFVSHDTPHIDSIALITTYSNFVITVPISILFSIKVDVSKLYPKLGKEIVHSEPWEKKRIEIADLFRNGFYMSSIAVPFSGIILVFSGNVLNDLFKQNKNVAFVAQDFLRFYALNTPAIIYGNCCRQMIYGFSELKAQRIGFYFVAAGIITAGTLSYYDLLATNGIVLGYGICQYGTALTYAYFLFIHEKYQDLKLKDYLLEWPTDNKKKFANQMLKSLPIFFINTSETTFIFCLSVMSGFVSAESQAAFALVMQYITINFWIGTNFAMSSLFVMNQIRAHENNKHKVFPTALNGILLTSAASSIIPIFFACYPNALMSIFNLTDPEILAILIRLTPWMSLGSILDSSYYGPMLQLRTLDDIKGVMMTRIPSIMVGLILAITLGFKTDLGIDSLGYAYVITMTLSFTCVLFRWVNQMQPHINHYYDHANHYPKFVFFQNNNRQVIKLEESKVDDLELESGQCSSRLSI